jgi:ABC-type spermidine/putrescine transport system permease subunit II
MPEYLYLLTILLPLATLLLIFGFKYGSAAYQAHAHGVSDTAYRDLAQNAAAAQSATASALAAVQTELEQLTANVAAVTKILKDVE